MPILFWIIFFSFFSGVFGLLGGLILLINEKFARRLSFFLVSFAIGTLLGATFFDLIPEAFIESQNNPLVLTFILFGIIFFFLIEKFLIWHHCQNQDCTIHAVPTYRYMILIGDSFHNLIDGAIIALSFMISFPLGIVASLAVFFHEIPQEISDAGVLLQAGMKRAKIIWYNLLSALSSILGAIFAFFIFGLVKNVMPFFLAMAAGNFIYIALSDLIPEIHKELRLFRTVGQVALMFLGVFIVWFLTKFFEVG